MNEPARGDRVLGRLVGKQLSAVAFVQDYLQLQFDGPHLNAYVWPSVKLDGATITFGNSGYRDALCSLITASVASFSVEPSRTMTITFNDGSLLEFSLQENDRQGPEAIMLRNTHGKEWAVW